MKLNDLRESSPGSAIWTVKDGSIASCVGYHLTSLKDIQFSDEFIALSDFADISVDISDNDLTSFEYFPRFESYQDVDATHNKIKSCKWLPRTLNTLWIHNNEIASVKDDIVPYFDSLRELSLSDNPAEKGALLSLFRIKGLEYVGLSEHEVHKIMNKYLKIKGRGHGEMLDCQTELIEAGYEAQAKL